MSRRCRYRLWPDWLSLIWGRAFKIWLFLGFISISLFSKYIFLSKISKNQTAADDPRNLPKSVWAALALCILTVVFVIVILAGKNRDNLLLCKFKPCMFLTFFFNSGAWFFLCWFDHTESKISRALSRQRWASESKVAWNFSFFVKSSLFCSILNRKQNKPTLLYIQVSDFS